MRHHHGPHCRCQACAKKVVYPVKENTVHCCSEETVEHIHPSHTTVVNHHLVKNKHVFPQSTSFENTWNSVNEYGGAFNVPGNQVGGAMSPGKGKGNQVGGVMSPGKGKCNQVGGAMAPGQCHGSQVGGTMHPGMHQQPPVGKHPGMQHHPGMPHHHGGYNHWQKPNKW